MTELLGTTASRRAVLRMAGAAGVATLVTPRLAFGAEPAALMPQVAAVLDCWIAPDKLPGLVAVLGRPGREAEFLARGTEAFSDANPVGPDSLFRIYSMTKPVSGMAAMILIDAGKLQLDQPVSDILPKFARMQVQVTPDGSISELRAAKTPITIRHLLTHTSGLGYPIVQKGPLRDAFVKAGLIPGQISRIAIPGFDWGKPIAGLKAFADGLAAMPLVHEPGTRWVYSSGLDLMGRVIEVVSGQRFESFLQQRLFDPLGMTSTYFRVPAREAGRLTTNYGVAGKLVIPIDPGATSVFLDPPKFATGGAGLVSSPRDYDRFLRMLAQFGTLGGRRVMSERAVRLGTSNLLPAGVRPANGGGHGAGGRVGMGAEEGIFGWSGAAGTVAMVDMKRGLRSALYAQFMPSSALPILTEFQKALRSDIAALLQAA